MKDMMQYKDYVGAVHYSDEDATFFGKVEFIRDLISYEGQDVKTLRAAFEEAVDDYLAWCEKEGKEAEQPFKGSFNIRPGSDLHRRAALFAKEHDINLNQVASQALEKFLDNRT